MDALQLCQIRVICSQTADENAVQLIWLNQRFQAGFNLDRGLEAWQKNNLHTMVLRLVAEAGHHLVVA
jgi:rhodanese-related sulfurtransferase